MLARRSSSPGGPYQSGLALVLHRVRNGSGCCHGSLAYRVHRTPYTHSTWMLYGVRSTANHNRWPCSESRTRFPLKPAQCSSPMDPPVASASVGCYAVHGKSYPLGLRQIELGRCSEFRLEGPDAIISGCLHMETLSHR